MASFLFFLTETQRHREGTEKAQTEIGLFARVFVPRRFDFQFRIDGRGSAAFSLWHFLRVFVSLCEIPNAVSATYGMIGGHQLRER